MVTRKTQNLGNCVDWGNVESWKLKTKMREKRTKKLWELEDQENMDDSGVEAVSNESVRHIIKKVMFKKKKKQIKGHGRGSKQEVFVMSQK